MNVNCLFTREKKELKFDKSLSKKRVCGVGGPTVMRSPGASGYLKAPLQESHLQGNI